MLSPPNGSLACACLICHDLSEAINSAAIPWGVTCFRCEVRDIQLPDKVVEDMQRQVSKRG